MQPTTELKSNDLLDLTISFIGGGNMSEALIGGLRHAGLAGARIRVANPTAAKRERLQQKYGIVGYAHGAEAVVGADVVVLSVKPQIMRSVLAEIPIAAGTTVVSVAAGLSSDTLRSWIAEPVQMVRVMPNTPSLMGQGMSGLYADASVPETARAQAEFIAAAAGQTVWLDEEAQMHALTALSGSGPAYYFLFTEALREAGVKLGLDPALANRLATATLGGAAAMASAADADDVQTLRARVTSKGGATAAAVASFEANDIRRVVLEAATACRNRSIEMGTELDQG